MSDTFGENKFTTLVVGATSGLGERIEDQLATYEGSAGIVTVGRHSSADYDLDITDWRAVERMTAELENVREIIYCAGVNWLERFEDLAIEDCQRIMDINCWGMVHLVQTLRDQLADGGRVVNVISSAANVPMTHSLAYNASKAALQIVTRQMARELKDLRIVGVNPTKIAGTGMSDHIDREVQRLRGWSREQAAEYQRQAMASGSELDVERVASFVVGLLLQLRLSNDLTGTVLDHGA